MLHMMRLKYSWRMKENTLRESVSMPMKRESMPMLARDTRWRSIPSFWSLNHHAAPNCILPRMGWSWKLPAIVARTSLWFWLSEKSTVLGSSSVLSRMSRKRARGTEIVWSPMELKPDSGPCTRNFRVLLLRWAHIWSCMTQPRR